MPSSATVTAPSSTAQLEDEAITIFREIAAECERPVLLFSGGKDSVVMLHLAHRAFWPARIPFPVMHVDTGHNFDEVIEFRDRAVADFGVELVVASVQDSIDAGRVREDTGPRSSRNPLQTVTLLDAIAEHRFDAVFGGARRDEERARAKERVVSHRDEFGQWDPKNQRPELWGIYNTRHHRGEHLRVFPLSNWTELDIWRFIAERKVDLPSLYYAHQREVFLRDGMLMAVNRHVRAARRRGAVRGHGALPHDRRRHVHGRRRVLGVHRRGHRRRDRRRPGHRARRDPGRRPHLRGRHGRPQAPGVLLTDAGELETERSAVRARCGSPPSAASTTASRR